MKSNQVRVLCAAVFTTALWATTRGVAGELPDSPKVQLDALEKRVAALERRREARPPGRPESGRGRSDANGTKLQATSLECYLQYPGQ